MTSQTRVILIESDLDIVSARVTVRDIARRLGFGTIDQARIATTVSELARNIYIYAGTGAVKVRTVEGIRGYGLELEFEDHGPGIRHVDLLMQEVFNAPSGTVKGLPGVRQLMHEFEIHSAAGHGTTIVCRKWPG